jgi:hypothetical protein
MGTKQDIAEGKRDAEIVAKRIMVPKTAKWIDLDALTVVTTILPGTLTTHGGEKKANVWKN